MANVSQVYGDINLEGEWTPEMVDCLNSIKNEWTGWYYGITVKDFEMGSIFRLFTANGRWSFDTNLSLIGIWTKNSENDTVIRAYKMLCHSLKANPFAMLKLSFVEEERGFRLLRKASAEIKYFDGELVGFITNEENYEYTKDNLVRLEFYASVDDIDWM